MDLIKLKINQATKSLIYLSILCIFLETFRLIFKNDTKYSFLFWNLFLAWIPFCLTQLANRFSTTSKFWTFTTLFFWLLFFPNSPYIITDLLHLKGYSQNILWFDSLLIFLYGGTGLLIGLNSLQTAQQTFRLYLGRTKTWIVLCSTILLSGFGIYLGRYCRLNSWDLFHRPLWFFGRVIYQFENPLTFKVTLTYGFVILCLYLIFYDMYKFLDKEPLVK
jgi:uncharacterized membrane protein